MKKILPILIITTLAFTTSCLKEDDGVIDIPPIQGSIMAPEVGGAAQPNQVWIDLSTNTQTVNRRTDWDLGFYTGDEFFVILNNSILMAAAQIDATDIDAVTSSDFSSQINIINPAAGFPEIYIDNVAGNYLNGGTAIDEISTNPSENKVYLLKLGYETYQGDDIPNNSTYTAGDPRGYKKIRILRNNSNSYTIQYADLDDTTHQEFVITKNPDYNFTFFSFDTQNEVQIQPTKSNWDLCFTVWNNVIAGHGTYIYADFIFSNTMAGVSSYEIITDPLTLEMEYNNFTLENVDQSLFISDDQRAIGSNWRSTVSGTTSTPVINSNRFYVIKDTNGIVFKLRFLSMLSESGERGYPTFEFDPL